MTAEQYKKMLDDVKRSPRMARGILIAGKGIVWLTFVAYAILLAALCYRHEYRGLYESILVPAVSFFCVSIFRKLYKSQRPYEVFGVEPLIPKETKGKSFPSRHVFSAFMIGMTIAPWNAPAGCLILLLGTLLAITRVLGGVHFPRDVIAGAALGILCAVLGYYVIGA